MWQRLFRHRAAVYGGILLLFFYLLVGLADFVAPYSETFEDRQASYMPPSAIHLVEDGTLHLPFVYRNVRVYDEKEMLARFVEEEKARFPLRLLVRGEKYRFLFFSSDLHLFGVEAPARLFLCGADQDGRDIFSRILFGGRVSLMVGLFAIFLTVPIGLLVGGISGYFGGWIDGLCMRVVEALMAIPAFYLLLALFGLTYRLEISPTQRFFLITGILSLVGWTGLARVIRGQVLVIRELEYVEAARALGAGPFRILFRHVLPQTASWVVVSASLAIPGYILSESALSMIGLGVQPPAASWGNMLSEGMNYAALAVHPWLLYPGLAIVLAVIAFNLLGDGLRDALDSKQRV
ncbi:MAG TPA: ABC transporter permease [Cyanobacteria bacterium UBA8530]|nr:ABC transporter permease [Cyanobacteria bacterium UBA8530]